MPAVFVGHGSPMNTLQSNCFTKAWPALGARCRACGRSWPAQRTQPGHRSRLPHHSLDQNTASICSRKGTRGQCR